MSAGTVLFGGPLFEVALALLFVFVAMSALVSSVQELIVQVFRLRSRNLRRGITRLLSDTHYKDEIAKRFYRHPMISSLGRSGTSMTSVEPDAFLHALASAIQPSWSNEDAVTALPNSIAALADGELKQRLALVVPPPSGQPDRELIVKSVEAWFQTSISKIAQRYKADATALSYIVAASLTVFLNVSPIEIGQRLMQDNSLRTAFASTVPELSTLVFNTGQGLPIATPVDANAPAEAAAGASPLSTADVQTMLAVFQCSRNEISFPVGWPWMGEALNSLAASQVASLVHVPSEKEACTAAVERASSSPALQAKLAAIGTAPIGSAAVSSGASFQQYGPSFVTDSPALILLGWLLMTFAAAQGAPFWFDALRRVLMRR